MELGTYQKGLLAELKVRQRALELGTTVSIPVDASARYDAILDDGQRLYRAQIKYCDRGGGSDGAIQVELTSSHRSGKLASVEYTEREIDVLLLYVPRLDKILWLGPEVFSERHAVQIRIEPSKNGQTKGCLFATDFVW